MPGRVSRRSFLKASGTAGAAGALAGAGTVAGAAGAMAAPDHQVPSFPFEEATIAQLQAAMTAGRLSSAGSPGPTCAASARSTCPGSSSTR